MTRHQSRSSSRDREIACPASIVMTPLVAPPKRDDGDEGSYLHWEIADRAIRELGAIPPEGGLPPPNVPQGYKLPANSLWIADWCIRHLQEMVPTDWSLMVEVEMEHAYPRWDDKGHADIVAISPDGKRAKGFDWKTGRDPVDPADENWQVFDYQCLISLEWPSIDGIEFQVVQPRLSEEAGERVSISVLEGDRLKAAPGVLDAHMCRSLDNLDEINSGRKQCRWCNVKLQCPAKIAERDFMKMKLTKEALAAIKAVPDDAVLGEWVVVARSLRQAMDDASELLHERLDATGVVVAADGTTITRKVQRGSYTVERPQEFLASFRQLVPADAHLAQCFDPSMTRIKDVLAEVMDIPKGGKSAVTAESVFDAHLRPHVKQGERRVLQFT